MGFRLLEAAQYCLTTSRDNGSLGPSILFIVFHTLAGISVLAVAVWLYLDRAVYLVGIDSSKYFTAIYILMAAGIVMTIIGFLGCCGALRESPCMLGAFFILLLVLFAAEITGGVWAYMKRDELREQLKDDLYNIIIEEYGKSVVINKTIDAMQHDLECCGANQPKDWLNSKFMRQSDGAIDLGVVKLDGVVSVVPTSCCLKELSKEDCEVARRGAFGALIGSSILKGLYNEGCADKLQTYLEKHLVVVAGVGLGLGVLQVLGLILSLVTCCAIRSGENFLYKA